MVNITNKTKNEVVEELIELKTLLRNYFEGANQ